MLLAIVHTLGILRVHVRIVEETQPELGGQHAGGGLVYFALRHGSRFHLRHERAIDGAVGKVVVDPRGERQARGIRLVGRHLMRADQHLQAVAIGGDVAVKSPLLAQNAVEQPVIDVRGNAVDLVIGGHNAAHMSFLDGGLKGNQKILADDPFGVVARSRVGAAFRLAVHGKVLGGGQHMMAINEKRIAL